MSVTYENLVDGKCCSNFFEGVEKLLEIWLSQSKKIEGSGDARDITRYCHNDL